MQFLRKREKHWLFSPPPHEHTHTQELRPWGETSLGGWYIKREKIEMCFFFALAATCIVFQCMWPWMLYWLASRLNGFVEKCYCHKTKKPEFNGLASPHEGRVQSGFQLGTVEVVFDQLLSAWLGVNRWTNYTHTCIYSIVSYYCAQEDLTIIF